MKIKINIKDAQYLHALNYQANMTLVRCIGSEDDLKRFYNINRLARIKEFVNRHSDFQYCEKHSFLDIFKTKMFDSENIFLSREWLFKSLGSLRTLTYFVESLDNVPDDIYRHLRTQFTDYSFPIKLKPFPSSVIYFARHDLKAESYMDTNYLWLNELDGK